jgi:adenine-specific DNA-methyltransferase
MISICSEQIESNGTTEPHFLCKIYTSFPLALGIVKALGDVAGTKWLEPSHGQGVFLQALAELGVSAGRIRAIDLDTDSCANDHLARTLRGIDFLRWSMGTQERFDRIVGNPPYIAISQLVGSLRKTAACVEDFNELPIGSCSNMWHAFVLCTIRLLREGGSLGFVLPSAVEYAEYSGSLRKAIRDRFESIELLRCRRPLFSGVQEGTVVVIARGYKQGPFKFSRKEFRTGDRLISALSTSKNGLRRCSEPKATPASGTVLFSEIAKLRLGGVTGDSRYFLLTDKQRREHRIPTQACRPVVSRARHLHVPVLKKADWDFLKLSNQRVWLFKPGPAARKRYSVRLYLAKTSESGGCDRSAYKVRLRSRWYDTPLPPRPDGFVSGMSRFGPWICLNQFRRLNATNTLYVIKFHREISENERFGYALALLSSKVQRQLRKSARRYADGLIKYEPGALTNLQLPRIPAKQDCRKPYVKAVRFLLDGQRSEARKIADDIFR